MTPEGLPKAAGAEPCGKMRDEQLHAVVARSRFRSQHMFRDFSTFSRASIFFLLTLSSDYLTISSDSFF